MTQYSKEQHEPEGIGEFADDRIWAKVVQGSVCGTTGKTVYTIECNFPNIILPEVLTHRQFGRNTASNRAIPVWTQIKHVFNNMFIPSRAMSLDKGMSSNKPLHPLTLALFTTLWGAQGTINLGFALLYKGLKIDKQWANRGHIPWGYCRMVITATEWRNFLKLRVHEDAQPEIQELGRQICSAILKDVPLTIYEGHWHVPYVERARDKEGAMRYVHPNTGGYITIAEAKAISASICAQMSYRTADSSLSKARKMLTTLLGGDVKHSSPFNHQCTPLLDKDQIGCSHVATLTKELGSGNLWGFAQNYIIMRQEDDFTGGLREWNHTENT